MAVQLPSYTNVPVAEKRDEASSTETDDIFLSDDEDEDEDEKRWHSIDLETAQPRRRRNRILMALVRWQWLVNTSLLLAVVGLLLLRRVERARAAGGVTRQVGGDFAGSGPEFSTKIVKWEADTSFTPMTPADFFSHKTLDRWNTLMPAGTGWGSTETTFFTTTMTHQLHCIFMMGRIYASLATNRSLPDDYHTHYMHCIDYLRQAAMCAGDVALEAHGPSDADDNGPLDGGWSGHHVCKDYSEVTQYLEGQIKDGIRTVLPIDD